MLKKIGLVISVIILIINILNYNFEFEFNDVDNKVSLIGILASLCAILVILILIISEKIEKKNQRVEICVTSTPPSIKKSSPDLSLYSS